MIAVYFEKRFNATIVARFATDELYMACLPALEAEAKKGGFKITEAETD